MDVYCQAIAVLVVMGLSISFHMPGISHDVSL